MLWTIRDAEDRHSVSQAEDRTHFAAVDAIRHHQVLEIDDFLGALVEDRPPAVTGVDGRRVVALFHAI